jgi:mRNA interferase HigB
MGSMAIIANTCSRMSMRVHGLEILHRFSRKHAAVRKSIEAWLVVVEHSDWTTPHHIKAMFSSADFLVRNRVIFNLKGNHYRLVIKVAYKTGVVIVEWIGTHQEYDKMTF